MRSEDDLCTGLYKTSMKPKNVGGVHKWRKEVSVKKTWCKLGSGLFGWRRRQVISWRHKETGSIMTNKEYTSYCGSELKSKGRTHKEDIGNILTFNSTYRTALPPMDGTEGQKHQGLSEISERESDFRPNI